MVDFEKAFDSISWKFMQKSLKYFNFGPDILKWVKTFYTDCTASINVNGQYSKWFDITRGVRQGDPLSPYLFLICAEIMSSMIRENTNIKGIKLNIKNVMLSQFADDTTVFLDGSERSFRECIRTLKLFATMSGLKINSEKTQVVWIGNRKNSQIKYMPDCNFSWNPDTFKVLGVVFSTNVNEISSLNYNDKLNDILKTIKPWTRRQLTPFGKITILKTLVLSKLTYLFINIPDPSDEFLKELDKLCFEFLWNGKNNKISKSVTWKPYEEGGLRMIDMRSFLTAMKVSWVRRIHNESNTQAILLDMYPQLQTIRNLGGEYGNTLMTQIKNPFWMDVCKNYKKLYCKCNPQHFGEFCCECIHYNIHIIRDKRTIHIKKWIDNEIFFVWQLVGPDGAYLSFGEFCDKYPGVETSFLNYRGVVNAIKQYQRKLNIESTDRFPVQETKTWQYINKGNKSVYSFLTQNNVKPTPVSRWNRYFGKELNWKKIFQKHFKSTPDVQLRWFQSRLLYNILPTNRYLHLCKIKDSPLCTFCGETEETITHMFWHCQRVQQFWTDLAKFLQDQCTHCDLFNFSEEIVILGVKENVITDLVFDLILLLSKFHIYKCKLGDSRPNINTLHSMIRQRYEIEQYNHCVNDKREEFQRNWNPYMSIVRRTNAN